MARPPEESTTRAGRSSWSGPTRILAIAILCVFALIACGGNAGTGDTSAVSGFPMTVENCGEQVTFEEPPARVLLITRYFAPLLEAIGALDKVVAKVGESSSPAGISRPARTPSCPSPESRASPRCATTTSW